jgi:hypothetical protein
MNTKDILYELQLYLYAVLQNISNDTLTDHYLPASSSNIIGLNINFNT